MLSQQQLARILLPVGHLTKYEVRQQASALGLRTATKPDSQDVCFISPARGREEFLGDRIPLRPARLVDMDGAHVGELPALELVTVGQRRGLGSPEPGGRRYVVAVDNPSATVTVGPLEALLVREIAVVQPVWVDGAPGPDERLLVQMSAHGRPMPGRWAVGTVVVDEPVRRVAPGQSVVLYRGDAVVGGGLAL